MYLRFCSRFGFKYLSQQLTALSFVSLSTLSTYCKYCTIINYLSAINFLYRHFGHDVAFQDEFCIKLITRGLRRILGDDREQKLPITPRILLRLRPELTADKDSGFWAAMLIGFYSFSRKSNLVPKAAKHYTPRKRCPVRTLSFALGVWLSVFVGQRPPNSGSVNYLYLLFAFRRVIHFAQFKPTSAMFVSSPHLPPRLPFWSQGKITSPQ